MRASRAILRAIWRVRYAIWGRLHFRECGNCRYYQRMSLSYNDRCAFRGWRGDDVETQPDRPGCERWRRLHEEPEAPE